RSTHACASLAGTWTGSLPMDPADPGADLAGSPDHAALDAWIDAHFDEETAFLAEMVKVPTDTPPGDNAPHAERTAKLLEGFGFAVERHPVPADEVRDYGLVSITNLIVRRRHGDGPCIALNAHGDVVPPGEGW